jgi:gluconate 2-dehydrogenase gamma chain
MSQIDSDPLSTSRSNKTISRRSFLKMAGASLGVAVGAVACDVLTQEEEATRQVDLPLSNREQYQNIPGPQDMPPPGMLGFFTPDEARTVEALTATILPGSPDDPGAREAGVVFYIDALLWYDRGFGTRTYYRPPFAMAYEGSSPPTSLNFTNTEVLWVPKELMSRFGWQSILTPRELYRMGIMAVNSYANTNFGAKFADLSEEQQEEIMTALAEDEMDPIGGLDSSEFFDLLRDHTIEGMFSDPIYRGNRDMVGWKLIGYPGAQRAYTRLEMQDEAYVQNREPQSITMLHPFNPGEPSHPNAILPVSGSGTPGVEEPNIHPHP